MLTNEQFDAWLVALRSGKYTQGRGVLRRRNGESCCLGVLADTLGAEYVDASYELEPNTYVFVNLPNTEGSFVGMLPESVISYIYQDKFSAWNDRGHATFEEIAANLETYRKQLCSPQNKSTTG